MLQTIDIRSRDHIYILGDLFDRCESRPDPVGVYFNVLGLGEKVSLIAGNHDIWLSQYIDEFFGTPERKRKKLKPHHYNTFSILHERLTEVDLLNLSSLIKKLPLQISVRISDKNYLMAHAQTCNPCENRELSYYVMGDGNKDFFDQGIDGYISICGHTDTSFMYNYNGWYSEDGVPSIWRNTKGNLIMMDCGCGFESGRLACICIETGEEFYV